jgi:hypothetical protein
MATTENSYTSSANQTLFSFTFPYIDTTDIKVSVDSVVKTITTDYTLASATQIQFNTAPGASKTVRIYRDTDADAKKASFFAGSAIRSQDLNENFDQTLYKAQELIRDVGNIWDDTTETINSSETWVDSDAHIATCAAIEDKINAITSGGVFSAADPTKLPLAGGTLTGEVIHNYTSSTQMPAGTTAQRPGSPTNGDFRYNSDDSSFEGYQGGSWGAVGGGATGPDATSNCFWENDQEVSNDYTITNNKNAGSFGPITVAAGKTVTVGAGEVWTVV